MNSGSSCASSQSHATSPSVSCWPKLTALCAYSPPAQDIAECARSAPRFGSSYCRRSLHHFQLGIDALARDRLDRRSHYPEGCIQARRSESCPHPERSRTTFIAAALRGILLAQSGSTFPPLRSIPECQQTPQFLIAADKPGNLSSTRLETTRDRSLPPHAPPPSRP